MKIALASAKFINNDIAYNLHQMERYAHRAKDSGADLICFGETFLQGFDSLCWNYEKDKEVAVELSSPPIQKICRLSCDIGIDFLFGFVEREEDRLYSSCALISNGQILYDYRRISPGWKVSRLTDHHYQEGNLVQPFEYRGKQCLIALCGDLWVYPERFDLGQDILFWPIYVNFSIDDWQQSLQDDYTQQAGKISSDVLIINSLSQNPDAFGGCFHFCDNRIQDSLPYGQDGLLTVTL